MARTVLRRPSRHSGKRRHPERERGLTIAAGFVCSDGLVLAADTQFTGIHKRHGSKLWWFRCGQSVVAIAGAGIATYMRHAKEQIRHQLKDGMSDNAIVEVANNVVFALAAKHAQVDAEDWDLNLLLGICSSSGVSMYENQSGFVFAPVETENKSQCIGCGRSLGLYFTDWLFDPILTTRWATTIAAHLLNRTKALDPDCGGDSYILVVPSDLASLPYRVEQGDIAVLEAQLGPIEAAMRDVLVYSPGLNLNAETTALRFKALEDAVTAARSVIVGLTGVDAVGVTGHVTAVLVNKLLDKDKDGSGDSPVNVEG